MTEPHDEKGIKRMMRVHMLLFVLLVALTVTSASIGMLKALAPNTVRIVFGIAAFQVLLVAGVLMHLFGSKKFVVGLAASTVVFAAAMVGLIAFAHGDPITGTQMIHIDAPGAEDAPADSEEEH